MVGATATLVTAADHEFTFDCEKTFSPDANADSLAKQFGAEHLTTADIYIGEGSYEAGSVLFADDAKNRVEILWKNAQKQESPRIVGIRGKESHWRTIHGLSLGSDLRTLERINGVPFLLAGFAWDYSGTVISWSGGLLEGAEGRCRALVRLAPELHNDDPIWSNWYEQVIGDREFSSNHPAMQELNPKIYAIELSY
jgi:hypothetical protein